MNIEDLQKRVKITVCTLNFGEKTCFPQLVKLTWEIDRHDKVSILLECTSCAKKHHEMVEYVKVCMQLVIVQEHMLLLGLGWSHKRKSSHPRIDYGADILHGRLGMICKVLRLLHVSACHGMGGQDDCTWHDMMYEHTTWKYVHCCWAQNVSIPHLWHPQWRKVPGQGSW